MDPKQSAQTPFTEELKRLKQTVKRRLKTAKKYFLTSQDLLAQCQNWQALHHEAELLQTFLYTVKSGMKEIAVADWERDGQLVTIALDPKLKAAEEIAKRFNKSKKYKKGLPYAEKEFARAESDVAKWSALVQELESIDSFEKFTALQSRHTLPEPQNPKDHLPKEPPKPYWHYRTRTHLSIYVGKSAAKNDELTFRHAHGNDLWLHASEVPGSHVVLRIEKNQPPDQDSLQDALQLALYHSKAKKGSEGEISMTYVKHVKKFGREKGKVQLANEKRFFIRLNPERIKELRATLHHH